MANLPSCTEYTTSIVTKDLIKAPMLKGGAPEMYNNRPIRYAGGFCIVFPFHAQGKKYAVRCWHAYLEGAEERTKRIAQALKDVHLPYFVGFEYINDGILTSMGMQPVVVMDWVEAKTLKQYIADNINNASNLTSLAKSFAKMAKDLHEHSISHGDLQHGNIMVKDDGSLILVDYDSMYVPALAGWTDEINGLAGYQHPARWKNRTLSPKADFFSELIIYTSLMALAERPSLWNDLQIEDSDTMLFSPEDIQSGGTSPVFSTLASLETCKDLSRTIKDFLSRNSIEELEPLENVTVSYIDRISELWMDNGYRPPKPYTLSDVDAIARKWKI